MGQWYLLTLLLFLHPFNPGIWTWFMLLRLKKWIVARSINCLHPQEWVSGESLGQSDWLHISWPPKIQLFFCSCFIMHNNYVYREVFEKNVLNYYVSSNGDLQSEYFSFDLSLLTFFLLLSDTSMAWINNTLAYVMTYFIFGLLPVYKEQHIYSKKCCGTIPHIMAYPQNMILLFSDDEMWFLSLVIFNNCVFLFQIIFKFKFNPKN